MAVQVNVAGLTTVKIQVTLGSLLTLGYARNEPEIILTPYYHDVHSDEFGGDQGPILESQFLGATATIRLLLSKWDPAVSPILEKFASQASAVGEPESPGSMMVAGNHTLRVLLQNNNDPRNYPRCFTRAPIEVNRGTKYSQLSVEFLAIENASGVLWNTTTV